ncbi:MAG: molybdopterin oxidoreductase [Actinobacteria bacterium]|jgi:anaerobic selenocysteine-containing dehydrogenase|nr:MAG: molybdopterin oxidoreductase [Actinomycetota bacterium]
MGDKVFKSSCKMCHGGCGVLVYLEDGEIVRIEGDKESPLNRGRMCAKGRASLEHLNHPDRLRYPMKRAGERGGGKWERLSWDEALDEIAGRLQNIRQEYSPESIALGQGTGRRHFNYVVRLANALGTPNWCEPGCAQCFIPRLNTSVITFGEFFVCDYYGEVNPACILVWGHNPLTSGPDGELQFPLRDSLKRGSRLIVVDPRRSETAEKAELWLQLRPGTDDALALAMLNVIIGDDLYDREFVDNWTSGFEELAERVEAYTPAWAEEITWVPAEKIREAARLFATSRPATLEWGVAVEHTPNCFQTCRALAMLPAITGNIDVPGGWVCGTRPIGFFPFLAENLSNEARDKRLGGDTYRILGGNGAIMPAAHAPTVFRAMRTGEPYPVKAFLVFGNNTLSTYANPREVYASLMNLDLLVVTDIYMTPTAELADLVLPAATWLEADGLQAFPIAADLHVLAQQKLASRWECRQDEDIMIQLAQRMGLEVGTEPLREVLDRQLEPLGLTFEELKEKGHVSPPLRYGKYKEMGMFLTASGKVELCSQMLERLGYDPLPYYEEPPESPVSTPELHEEYPLILITGARIAHFFHSEHRQIPFLRRKHPEPLVEIHPEMAEHLGIVEGDWVYIETRRGKITQRARLTDTIDPRVVSVEHGWWFPEEKGPEHGVWKSNANLLTDNGPPYDPAMGTYQLRALLCRVYPAETGDAGGEHLSETGTPIESGLNKGGYHE